MIIDHSSLYVELFSCEPTWPTKHSHPAPGSAFWIKVPSVSTFQYFSGLNTLCSPGKLDIYQYHINNTLLFGFIDFRNSLNIDEYWFRLI